MDKCQGILGKIFGHSYRAAVIKGAPNLSLKAVEGSSSAIGELIEKTRPETFHGIYCKRCGKVINGH